jgi:hypothetical protein
MELKSSNWNLGGKTVSKPLNYTNMNDNILSNKIIYILFYKIILEWGNDASIYSKKDFRTLNDF